MTGHALPKWAVTMDRNTQYMEAGRRRGDKRVPVACTAVHLPDPGRPSADLLHGNAAGPLSLSGQVYRFRGQVNHRTIA
jgi:hypothetical protein